MKTKSNIVSLLLLCLITLSIVRAQEGTPVVTISSTSILPPSTAPTPTASAEQTCLEQCAEDDVGCRAKCAGVPNPTEQQVNETKTCLDTCIPSDPSYLACRNSCIETFYNPKQTTTPSASAPMASASTGPSSTAKTPNGKNPSPSGSVAVKTSPFGSVFASLSAFIVVFMSVCCF